jgi:hypothetical protein
MSKRISGEDLIGTRFGKREILREVPSTSPGHRMFEVQCDCGNIGSAIMSALRSGRANQCKQCSTWGYTRKPGRFNY